MTQLPVQKGVAQAEKHTNSNVSDKNRTNTRMELKVLEDIIKTMQLDDTELRAKISALEARTESDRKQYEFHVRHIQADHAKQIEELLAQLDQNKVEQNAKKAKIIMEKDKVISALCSQLTDAQARLNNVNDAYENSVRDARNSVLKLAQASKEIESKDKKILNSQAINLCDDDEDT